MVRFRNIFCLIPGLLIVLSCSREVLNGGDGDERNSVPVQFALSLEGSRSETKASTTIITELSNTAGTNSNFRGMENICCLPFSNQRAVLSGDVTNSKLRPLPAITSAVDEAAFSGSAYHKGLVRNIRAHLYPNAYAFFPEGTASFLVYGQAVRVNGSSVQEEKHLNGSLIEAGVDAEAESLSVDDITFSPDPIYSGTISHLAISMADILTTIASAVSYTQVYYYYFNGAWREGHYSVNWNENLDEPSLKQYYRWFTGDGELMTGAGEGVEYMLTNLYGRITRFDADEEDLFYHVAGGVSYPAVLTEGGDDTFTYAYLYNKLRDEILKRFTNLVNAQLLMIGTDNKVIFYNPNMRTYPASLGLPSGAAVLRWNGIRYVVVTEGLDGIAPIDHYCYMPSLYYIGNTTLSTSGSIDMYDQYTSQKESWSQVLSAYRQGKVIRKITRSVAMDAPLQFAPGMLLATIRATASYLPDNDDDPRTNVPVNGTNFPVTGILIGSQHQQNFNFTPVDGSSEYYLYDNKISGVYLTIAESKDFRTLVLPTPLDEDVLFFMELRNDSGTTFTGAEGLILPGSYFYLAGKLEKSDDPAFPRIFMSDHCTTVNCTVSSLENAHVAVPEMGKSQLVMGVQCTLNWIMSASSYVVLD